MEIGPKMRKSLTLCLMGQWHSTVRDESSVMCLSGCSALRLTSIHLQFRHFLLPYYCFFPTLSFISLLVSAPLLSSCLLSSLLSFVLSFCVQMKGRQGLWQPLKQDRLYVCVGACLAKEQRAIWGITTTDLNYIKRRRDLFFMTFLWVSLP